jgi:MoaA/NifB/PqqE/SkfB family radical SAM enzyme
MEEDRVTRAQRILEVPPETVRELLERHAAPAGARAREVMFTSGEPLLNRHFLQYVGWARELGYDTIGVITNGRLFTYPKYARRALDAGLNHIVVSVHGADPRHHDAQTRTHASYAQTILGLRVLARLKRERPGAFRLHTSTVVNQRNYARLFEIWQSLRGLGIDQHVFNVIQPVGRAEVHFRRLVVRFTEVVAEFRRFLAQVAAAGGDSRAYLLDVPWCVSEGLPDETRGFVERYQYYEHDEGLDEALRFLEDGCAEDGACALPGSTIALPGPGRDGRAHELRRLTRRRLDETRKSHREACGRCRHAAYCDGVWNIYLEAYGWDEFQPVAVDPNGAPGAPDHDGAPGAPGATGEPLGCPNP